MTFDRWQALIDGMIEAAWFVDPLEFRIVAANRAAASMLGVAREELIGKPVIELTATPEDLFFWEDVAAGLSEHIFSETLLLRKDGNTLPVERRVSQVRLSAEIVVYLVAIANKAEQRRVEQELENLLAEVRATLESTADGVLVTDNQGRIRGYNHRFAELWSIPLELMTHRDDTATHTWMAQNVVDSPEYKARLDAIADVALSETRDIVALRGGRVLERISMPQLARGRPNGRVFSFRDITQQLADEAQLKLAAEVFESSLDAICVTDPQGMIAAVNPAFERLAGLADTELRGKLIWNLVLSARGEPLGGTFIEELDFSSAWEGEAVFCGSCGADVPVMVSLVRVTSPAQEPLHYIAFFKDITEKLAATRRIEELAYSDPLTGLPNRAALYERIEYSIGLCAREQKTFAVAFIDLDRFKNVNDSLGHAFGDRVLIEVARRIKACLRTSDTVARLGGDEFILLLHDTDALGVEILMQRLLQQLCAPIALDDFSLTLTSSIGIALYPEDGLSRDELIKNADTAMYQVKERGRSNFRFYQRQMNIDSLSRIKLDSAMHVALEQGHFRLRYQPQVDLATGRIIGVEALIRWNNEELGEVSPGYFIPVAEETGFIVMLGQWVLTEAVAQAARWQAAGIDLTVAINVSALQFQNTAFVESVAEAISQVGLAPWRLELELTESILIRDLDETLAKLEALRKLGVAMSIDDFGTGYSSLSYLKRFPVRRLKIDRSFVKGLPDDENDLAIVRAIVQLGLALRLRIVAEGVETERQKECLEDLGCQEFQGYLFAPDLDCHTIERMVTAQTVTAIRGTPGVGAAS